MEDRQMVFAIVVPILAVLVPFLIHIKNTNRDAHDQIGRNFNTMLSTVGIDGLRRSPRAGLRPGAFTHRR